MARSCLLALFVVGCLAVPSHGATAGAANVVAKQGVKAQIKRGTLRISGSRKGNTVTLRLKRRARDILEVDVGRTGRAEFRFRRKGFRRIVVRSGRGSDTLRISNQNGSFTGSQRTVVDGGRGSDVLALVGSRGTDLLTVAARGRRLRLTPASAGAGTAATRAVTAGSVEHLDIKPGRGADAVTVGDLTGAGVADVALELGSVAGGDGQPDTVVASGTAGGDTLSAGGGATRVVGGLPWAFGAAHFEGGLDRLVVNGLGGIDTLGLSGSEGPDVVDLSGAGGLMHAVIGETQVESDDVESLAVRPLRGADTVALRDLGGTDVGQAALDLGSTPGGPPDGETDSVAVIGREGADNVAVSSAQGISVTGLAAFTSIAGGDPGDRLAVNGLGGADTINAAGLAANAAALTLRGGPDADTLTGGPGDDLFAWSTGDGGDVVEGGAGTDVAGVSGGALPESFSLARVAARVAITTGAVNAGVMDMAGVERAQFAPGGGADDVDVPPTLGSELGTVSVENGVDAQADNVTLNGTPGPDTVSLSGGPGALAATGLLSALSVTGGEAANDRLTVNADAGSDTVEASGVALGAMLLTLNGDAGNDTLTGGAGVDTINGGADVDLIHGGPGADILNGGGQPGDQVFQD